MNNGNNGAKPLKTTITTGGVTGKGWKRGESGNPGGRPKGLAQMVRSKTKNGKELVEFMLNVMRGMILNTRTFTDKEGNEHSVEEGPLIRDRIAAVEWLADRGFGKVQTELMLSGQEGPLGLVVISWPHEGGDSNGKEVIDLEDQKQIEQTAGNGA